jgi:hypothetical protein
LLKAGIYPLAGLVLDVDHMGVGPWEGLSHTVKLSYNELGYNELLRTTNFYFGWFKVMFFLKPG